MWRTAARIRVNRGHPQVGTWVVPIVASSMATEKISVSLPSELLDYVDEYGRQNEITSRSHVLAKAISALRKEELVSSYQQSAREAIDPLLEADPSDGLQPSTADDW